VLGLHIAEIGSHIARIVSQSAACMSAILFSFFGGKLTQKRICFPLKDFSSFFSSGGGQSQRNDKKESQPLIFVTFCFIFKTQATVIQDVNLITKECKMGFMLLPLGHLPLLLTAVRHASSHVVSMADLVLSVAQEFSRCDVSG